MEIIVPDDQLSLAIGRKGQNVRLASQLTGWRLDIHSESRIQDIKDRAWKSLSRVAGCNEFLIQTLYNHGIRSAQQLLACEADFLLQFPGMDETVLAQIRTSAQEVAGEERVEDEDTKRDAQRAQQTTDVARRLQQLLRLSASERLRSVRGLGDTTLKALQDAEVDSVEALAELTQEALSERAGISEQKAKQLHYAAQQLLKQEAEIRASAIACGIEIVDGSVRVPGHEAAARPSSEATL